MSDITRTLCEYTYAHINKIPTFDATLVEARRVIKQLRDDLPNIQSHPARGAVERHIAAMDSTIYDATHARDDELKLQHERLAILEQYLGEGDSTP